MRGQGRMGGEHACDLFVTAVAIATADDAFRGGGIIIFRRGCGRVAFVAWRDERYDERPELSPCWVAAFWVGACHRDLNLS